MLSMQIQYTNMLSIVHYYRRLHLSVIYMYHCICMTRNKIQSHICQNDAKSNIFFGLTYTKLLSGLKKKKLYFSKLFYLILFVASVIPMQLEDFLKSHPNMGSGTRAFQQAIEKTKGNINWMDQNYPIVKQWLADQGFLDA